MNVKELDKVIRIGEGFTVEFKRTPSHLGREICAFANASGGYILLGVDDHGYKVGVTNLNRTKSEIQSAARNLDPPLLAWTSKQWIMCLLLLYQTGPINPIPQMASFTYGKLPIHNR